MNEKDPQILCTITNRPCVALSAEARHPGIELVKYEDGTITKVNNTWTADGAREISARDPDACKVFQSDRYCGAIYSEFVETWTELGADIDKVKKFLGEE
jgi:hypothetical protein